MKNDVQNSFIHMLTDTTPSPPPKLNPMKYRLLLAQTYLMLFLLSSCSFWTNGPKQHILSPTYILEEATVHPQLKGIWKSIGDGYIWDASGDSIFLYSYTSNYCFREENRYLEQLMHTESTFYDQKDTLYIYLADYGEKTSQLMPPRAFVKIERLPENCIDREQLWNLNPNIMLDLFFEQLIENHAFSKERGIHWDSIQSAYQSRLNDTTSQDSLFRLMGEIVTLTKDHHTKVISLAGQTLQYRKVPSGDTVYQSFLQQSDITEVDAYYGSFFQTSYTNITDSLLQGKGYKVANDKLEWGKLNPGLGYIHIHGFAGFSRANHSRKRQLDSINYYMEQIIDSLKDTEAMIVDLSFNFGGFDAAALTVASYFTDRPVMAYQTQVFSQGQFYDRESTMIYPAKEIQYTKPVYVFTTDITRSAAEGFAMGMKALPHVTTVGTSTLGILSGMLGKSLGNPYLTISNQRLMSSDGNYVEVRGVPPDIELNVFTVGNVFNAHMEAIRKLIERLE